MKEQPIRSMDRFDHAGLRELADALGRQSELLSGLSYCEGERKIVSHLGIWVKHETKSLLGSVKVCQPQTDVPIL